MLRMKSVISVDFHQCMWGGERPKASRWVTNLPELAALKKQCDGKHTHRPWGAVLGDGGWGFHTADEAEYPAALCVQVASCLQAGLRRLGVEVTQPAPYHLAPGAPSRQRALQAAAGRQPRGRRYPPLIPEYKETRTVSVVNRTWSRLKGAVGNKFDQLESQELFGIDAHTCVLKCDSEVGGDRVAVTLGLYFTEREFVDKASALRHPFDSNEGLADELLKAAFD